MDRSLDTDLRARLAADGAGGIVDVPAIDAAAVAALANELGARHAVIGAPAHKRALIAAIADGLAFPDWFGHNWDALEETLSSREGGGDEPTVLTWLDPGELDAADASTFRSIVDHVVASRAVSGMRPLVVLAGPTAGAGAAGIHEPAGVPVRIRSMGKIHHVALIVTAIEPALALWRDMLGLDLETIMDIEHDRVRIAFLGVGESKIELVQPTDDSTGVARFLASKGEGFHHVCFEVANLAETLLRLELDGLELIDTAPRRGAEGPVAFIHPRSCGGVLVELIEAPGGPAWAALGFG
ncbi:MAG TPA: methylmalonyl-CoA epimerase [Methylomirabilota bacterium]|nr:methylmalonyl-CoA epimerase [Methylomirabilota bacterium]